MNEVKKCLKWLLLYSLLLAVNIIPSTAIIPFWFPTDSISSLYLMILSACLILRYYRRISGQKNLNAAMQRLAIMMFVFFLLRGIKYSVVGNVSALGRYTWYLYYLPMLFIPMLLFFVSLYVYAIDERAERRKWSYAVASLASGDDVKTVQENLGHHTASFTLDVYGHVTDQMRKESADRMENFIKKVSTK